MRIDTGDQALSPGLFITGRAIDLSGKKEIADGFCLQVMIELCRIEEIIFDGVTRAINLHITKSGNRLQCPQLNLQGQRAGETVQVIFLGGFSLWLQEELVLITLRKGDDLRLDAGAITRTDTLDLSVVEWRVRQALPQDVVTSLVGVGRPATQLPQQTMLRIEEREFMEIILTRLFGHLLKMDTAGINAHRCSGLHPIRANTQCFQLLG